MRFPAQLACSRLGLTSFSETALAKALEKLPGIFPSGPWLAGGAVRRTLQGHDLDSDFDFFFAHAEQAKKFCADLESSGATLSSKNDKNSTYIVRDLVSDQPTTNIQAITFRYYESAEAVIDSFDFTLCQFAFDGTDLVMSEFALWDVARKRLVPHKISYATSSLRRMLKYANQGYSVCSGALADILNQVVDDPQIIHAETKYID